MIIQLENYYPLIHKIINKFNHQDKDELFNECYLQLEALKERFDASKGCFETFAYQRLYYACKDFISRFKNEENLLDNFISNDDSESECRFIDLIEDELQLEEEISTRNFIENHNSNLTSIEKFIQKKYFKDGLTPKKIIEVYHPYHLIRSEQTIRKILKK